jgi:hypothetical protein
MTHTKDEALEALILKAGINPVMQGSCYVMHPEALQAVIDEAIKQALEQPAPDLLEALQELLAAERANSLEIVGRDTDGHPLNASGVARKKARAAIKQALEQPAPVQPIGYEKYAAIREGHRNASEEAYFAARPDLPLTTAMLKLFRDGFDRGYDTTPPASPVQEPDCVLVPRYLVGAACAAIVGKRDAPKTLEQLRRYTRGDLSTPPAAHVPLTDELSNAVQMACQLSFKDHGRRSVNEQAWQRLMQAVAAYTHGITEKGQP